MTVRPLELLDLPSLARLHNDVLPLDSTRALTRGNPLGAGSFLAYFNPTRHLYSAIADGNGASLLGGVTHTRGETFAKLLYLAPVSRLDHAELPALVENLSAEAGTWGAYHVLAEVDEISEGFTALRNSGFSVYAWQRMWNVSKITGSGAGPRWTRMKSVSLPAVQSLHYQIVPPLLHPIEPAPSRVNGFICNEGAKCYISVAHGLHGIVLTPLIHPEATEVSGKLAALIQSLPDRGNRPVYLCVRSYQVWLEPVLADLGALAGPRQAVMVKHLTRLIKEEQLVRAARPAGVSVQPSRVSRIEKSKS